MTDRERLIELCDTNNGWVDEVPAEKFADHLIANGVTFATDNNVGDKTNGDRFRAMSDEEAAKFMADKCLDGEIRAFEQLRIIPSRSEREIIRHKLYMQWLDYFKQPVKDGDKPT